MCLLLLPAISTALGGLPVVFLLFPLPLFDDLVLLLYQLIFGLFSFTLHIGPDALKIRQDLRVLGTSTLLNELACELKGI